MKYMFLLFNEASGVDAPPEEMAAEMQKWVKFQEDAEKRATLVSGEALEPPPTATTVSVRGGELILTDGPFIDTKEQLGGFYVFDCTDLDQAIGIARMIPWAPTGHIEVRPVWNPPGME
ncbi:MAG: YciI family protein [Dehalococcoidia bacterium]|nr:YciI family protein [Dehalococcoidia bacterium]